MLETHDGMTNCYTCKNRPSQEAPNFYTCKNRPSHVPKLERERRGAQKHGFRLGFLEENHGIKGFVRNIRKKKAPGHPDAADPGEAPEGEEAEAGAEAEAEARRGDGGSPRRLARRRHGGAAAPARGGD